MGPKNTYFLVFILVALIANGVRAAQHVVGGSQGWDESTDFDSWASAQTFKVGDQLVFKYSSGLHSMVELPNENAYKNCDIGIALDSKNSGNDVVKLTKPGTRYFACGTLGHCGQGMKVKITTVAGNAPSTPASPSSSSTSSSSPKSTSTSAALNSQYSIAAIFALVASLISSTLLLSLS
ncbi:Cupredoxin [Parasponia andersonii]|uniref:Cupredoxin n=1 Tax=Parasponia andersonii TaxID=3476 RepID=A0A2P5CJV6_PARAD|nr:Cupredoxin [Parasponia andersonii]